MTEFLKINIDELTGNKKIEKNVLNYLKKEAKEYVNHLTDCLDECDSPIEELLLIAFHKQELGGYYYNKLKDMFDLIVILQQFEVECNSFDVGKIDKYRVDFSIQLDNVRGDSFHFVVECDGYEFHSNKESFEKDRKRDMTLLKEGIPTIRLPGKEIIKDPNSCASDVFKTIYKHTNVQRAKYLK